MKIDLSQLFNNDDEVIIDETFIFDSRYYEGTDIRSLSNIDVIGTMRILEDETYSLRLTIKGMMILPCAITLVDINYPFTIEIDEVIDINVEEKEEYLKIINNMLDIKPIIWQNIVVEIPLKVVSPTLDKSKLKGDGWELLTEDKITEKLDPRLDKLRNLLDDREEWEDGSSI